MNLLLGLYLGYWIGSAAMDLGKAIQCSDKIVNGWDVFSIFFVFALPAFMGYMIGFKEKHD